MPEIQFRKYADPAHEQITDAGSLRWRTHGRFGGPIVLRIPVGYQLMGGDPWHAVCGEAVFAHLPGWQIAYPSTRGRRRGPAAHRAARRQPGDVPRTPPALPLYARPTRPIPAPTTCCPFGKAPQVREGDDALIVTWGDTVYRALEAANAVAASTGAETRILDLRTVVPWDKEAVMSAVKEIGRVLIVHEDTLTCGFGAEIAAQIADEAFAYLDAPVKRVACADVPSPPTTTSSRPSCPPRQRSKGAGGTGQVLSIGRQGDRPPTDKHLHNPLFRKATWTINSRNSKGLLRR